MPGYDWRTSGESAGGTSYPVSSPSHHALSQPSSGNQGNQGNQGGPPSIINPPPQVTAPPVQTGTWGQGDPYDEKGDYMDYDYVNPNTGLTVGQTQSAATAAAKKKEEARMLQMQEAQGLAGALGHIDKEQLQSYMDSGVLPAEIAAKNPELAKLSGYDSEGNPIYVDPKTGKAYDPRGKFTAGMSDMLSELQFMQDEGVYGGVSGYEAEVNRQKGAVVNEIEKWKNQGLNDNQINERLSQDPNFASLTTLFGGNAETAFQNLEGYDPTGVHSWREIEETAGRYGERDPKTGMLIQGGWTPNEDPNSLYNKYLNRGTLWDDPLSGILNAPGERHWGESGYGDYGDYFGDRRDAKINLLNALSSGAPAKGLEQSGFFDTLVDPYAEAQSTALQSGIFSGLMPGYTGEGMKRLLRSYGSGLQAPRYANVAKGGIVGLLGV